MFKELMSEVNADKKKNIAAVNGQKNVNVNVPASTNKQVSK